MYDIVDSNGKPLFKVIWVVLKQSKPEEHGRRSNKQITCGVLQGSILGPIIFPPYINDLLNCLEKAASKKRIAFTTAGLVSVLQRANYNAIGFPTTIARSFAACTNPKNEADPEIPKRLPSIAARAQPRSIDGSTVSNG